MKIFFRTAGYILITAFAAMMVLTFAAVIDYNLRSLEPISCMKGRLVAYALQDGGFIDAGEVEICGNHIEVSPVYGPNMEAHIKHLMQENQALRLELDSCALKQAL